MTHTTEQGSDRKPQRLSEPAAWNGLTSASKVPVEESAREPPRHRACLAALLLILAWAPVPLGSNRHWSLSLLCASVLSVAGIVSLRYLLTPAAIPAAIGGCRLFIVLLVLWALFPVVQLAPVPAAFEVLAGDDVLSAYRGLGAIRGDVTAHLSVDLDATLRGLLRQTTFVSVFMLVLILIDNASRLRVLMTMMLVTGAGQALYGLMVYLGGSELGLWSPGHTTEAVTGTYVNQNHFAGLMELTLPAGIGLAFGTFSRGEFSFARRPWLRTLLAGLLSRNLVILFAVFLMLSALILTASRGAIVALCVGVLSALAIGLRARDAVRPVLRIGLAFLVMALIAMLWFGPGSLGAKIGRLGVDSGRADLRATSSLSSIKNRRKSVVLSPPKR